VMIEQNTPLNIQTMEDFPTTFDFSISPAFGIFTAAIQDPSTTDSKMTFFCLKSDAYDSITASQVTMSIIRTRHKELKKLAKKLNLTNKSTRKSKHPYNKNAQEESSSRAKRLRTAANKYEIANTNTHLAPENAKTNANLEPENTEAYTIPEPSG
ncbi:14625_t:CDS:2, partial [Racocetra persica]